MKKNLFLIFLIVINSSLLIAQNLDSINQYTGWDESNPLYKIQKLQNEKISYSQIFDSGNKLFTADTAMNFRIWDLNAGKLLYSKKYSYLLPVYMMNDSIVVFRQNDKAKPDSSGSIWVLNLNLDSIIAKSNEKYLNYFHFTFSKDFYGNLVVSYGKFIPKTYYSSKIYDVSNMKIIGGHSMHTDFLFSSKVNKLIYEVTGAGQIEYSTNTYLHKNFYVVNKDTVYFGDGKTFYSSDAKYDFLSVKKFNKSESIAFLYLLDKLYTFSMDSLKLIRETPMPSNNASFIVTPNDYLIFFNNLTSEFIKYDYRDEKINKLKIDLTLGRTSIFQNQTYSGLVLVSDDGKIVQINNEIFEYKKSNILVTDDDIFQNKEVDFVLNTISDYDSLEWDFGDGYRSNALNPSHIYLDSGDYQIKLIFKSNNMQDTIEMQNTLKISKLLYPRLESNKYFGIAPLAVNIQNVTLDFPIDSLPEWSVNNISYGKSKNCDATLGVGTHKIMMQFTYNEKVYLDSISIEVYPKEEEDITKSTSYKYVSIYDKYWSTIYSMRSLTPLENDRFILNYDVSHHKDYYDDAEFFAGVYDDNFKKVFSIPGIKGIDMKFCAFPYMGYIVCTEDGISVYNRNNFKLFQKDLDWRKRQLILLNNKKYIGKLRDSTLEVYDRRLDFFKTIKIRDYFDFKEKIEKYYVIGVEKGDPDYFYIIIQTKSNFVIFQFDSECNMKNYLPFNGTLLGGNKRGEFLFINYRNSDNQKVLLQFDKKFLIVKDFNLTGIEYQNLCANENFFYITTEKKDNEFAFYLYDYKLNYKKVYHYEYSQINTRMSANIFYYNDDQSICNIMHYYDPDTYGTTYYLNRFVFPEKLEDVGISQEEKLSTTFPNPSENYVNLEVDLIENPKIEVYNMMGINVNVNYTLLKSDKGKDIYRFDISALPIGAYYYTISNGQKKFTGGFIKK